MNLCLMFLYGFVLTDHGAFSRILWFGNYVFCLALWLSQQGLSSAVTQLMEKIPIFVVRNGYRALLTIALMPIKQYTVFSFLQQFYKTLFVTTHTWNLQGKAQYAYTICWYKCTADPLRRQCIKVRAHKRYMQSKKNIFPIKNNILSTIFNRL